MAQPKYPLPNLLDLLGDPELMYPDLPAMGPKRPLLLRKPPPPALEPKPFGENDMEWQLGGYRDDGSPGKMPQMGGVTQHANQPAQLPLGAPPEPPFASRAKDMPPLSPPSLLAGKVDAEQSLGDPFGYAPGAFDAAGQWVGRQLPDYGNMTQGNVRGDLAARALTLMGTAGAGVVAGKALSKWDQNMSDRLADWSREAEMVPSNFRERLFPPKRPKVPDGLDITTPRAPLLSDALPPVPETVDVNPPARAPQRPPVLPTVPGGDKPPIGPPITIPPPPVPPGPEPVPPTPVPPTGKKAPRPMVPTHQFSGVPNGFRASLRNATKRYRAESGDAGYKKILEYARSKDRTITAKTIRNFQDGDTHASPATLQTISEALGHEHPELFVTAREALVSGLPMSQDERALLGSFYRGEELDVARRARVTEILGRFNTGGSSPAPTVRGTVQNPPDLGAGLDLRRVPPPHGVDTGPPSLGAQATPAPPGGGPGLGPRPPRPLFNEGELNIGGGGDVNAARVRQLFTGPEEEAFSPEQFLSPPKRPPLSPDNQYRTLDAQQLQRAVDDLTRREQQLPDDLLAAHLEKNPPRTDNTRPKVGEPTASLRRTGRPRGSGLLSPPEKEAMVARLVAAQERTGLSGAALAKKFGVGTTYFNQLKSGVANFGPNAIELVQKVEALLPPSRPPTPMSVEEQKATRGGRANLGGGTLEPGDDPSLSLPQREKMMPDVATRRRYELEYPNMTAEERAFADKVMGNVGQKIKPELIDKVSGTLPEVGGKVEPPGLMDKTGEFLKRGGRGAKHVLNFGKFLGEASLPLMYSDLAEKLATDYGAKHGGRPITHAPVNAARWGIEGATGLIDLAAMLDPTGKASQVAHDYVTGPINEKTEQFATGKSGFNSLSGDEQRSLEKIRQQGAPSMSYGGPVTKTQTYSQADARQRAAKDPLGGYAYELATGNSLTPGQREDPSGVEGRRTEAGKYYPGYDEWRQSKASLLEREQAAAKPAEPAKTDVPRGLQQNAADYRNKKIDYSEMLRRNEKLLEQLKKGSSARPRMKDLIAARMSA